MFFTGNRIFHQSEMINWFPRKVCIQNRSKRCGDLSHPQHIAQWVLMYKGCIDPSLCETKDYINFLQNLKTHHYHCVFLTHRLTAVSVK